MKLSMHAALAALALVVNVNAADLSVEALVTGLDNPCGIAAHPGTGELFVSDSAARQVLRVNVKSGQSSPVITGFPQDVYGKGPMYDIGPLGLALLDRETLVVGGGGLKDGQELLRMYTLPKAGHSIAVDDMKYCLGPIAPGEESLMGEGNFYGVAVGKHGIYITCNGDDTKGWVSRATLTDGTPGELKPFIATKVATNVDAPVGITIDKKGRLVIGQMGEINIPGDSLLTVYDADSGELVASCETGLYDIAALAYSPKSGKLYAVDFAWMDTTKGGLFRLDVATKGGTMTAKAVKVAPLDKPTAMAFGDDGTLYVTIFGTADEGSDAKPGQVVKIVGDL